MNAIKIYYTWSYVVKSNQELVTELNNYMDTDLAVLLRQIGAKKVQLHISIKDIIYICNIS